jgi:hypothetical protein
MERHRSNTTPGATHAALDAAPGQSQDRTADRQAATAAAADAAVARMAGDGASSATGVASTFYGAFAARNNGVMAKCYAPDVQFHDPLFGDVSGATKLMEMWTTLQGAAKNVQIIPNVQSATANSDGSWQVKVHWDAHYDLGASGRHVDNHSDTTLIIKDGKIISQQDDWDLSAWTQQAIPVIGGTPFGDFLASHAASAALDLIHAFKRVEDL